MLFCKLLLSPRPHARIRRIDASARLRCPACTRCSPPTICRLPRRPRRRPLHRRHRRRAHKRGRTRRPERRHPREAAPRAPLARHRPRRPVPQQAQQPAPPPIRAEVALTNEPFYEGEPILALVADSEELAADAIERIVVDFEPLPFVIDPIDGLRPGGPNGRTDGNVFVANNQVRTLKWTAADVAEVEAGRFPMNAEAGETHVVGDIEQGLKDADLVLEETSFQQTTPASAAREPDGDGVLAERETLSCTARRRAWRAPSPRSRDGSAPSPNDVVIISEYCGGGFGSKIPGAQSMAIPALLSKKLNGRPVMMRISREEETYIGRVASRVPGRRQDGVQEGRPRRRDRRLHRRAVRSVPAPGRSPAGLQPRVAALPGAQRALPRDFGRHQHAAARCRSARRAGCRAA